MRKCKKCGIEKPLTEYYHNGMGYLDGQCKLCKKTQVRKRQTSKITNDEKERIINEQRENAHKDRLLAGCVYEVWKVDDPKKNYIGKTWVGNITRRDYMGSGQLISDALKKYGRNSFRVRILAIVGDDFEASRIEEVLIDKRNPYYNIDKGGTGSIRGYGGKRGKKPRLFTNDEIDLARTLLENGYPLYKVAKKLGCNDRQMNRLLLENGINDQKKWKKTA